MVQSTARWASAGIVLMFVGTLLMTGAAPVAEAQGTGPTMLVPNLGVRTVVGGLVTPSSMAFLGPGAFLVLEQNTGRGVRGTGGAVAGTVLDLAVNFGSERGLLGIALHPDFPGNAGVYLYWTESTTGADTNVLANTPLLGSRAEERRVGKECRSRWS